MTKILLTLAVAAGALAVASFSATAMPLAAPQAPDLVHEAQYNPMGEPRRGYDQRERGYDGRGYDRRGHDRRGHDRGYDRGYERGHDRGYDRSHGRRQRPMYRPDHNPGPVFYRNGRRCQRSVIGVVICR